MTTTQTTTMTTLTPIIAVPHRGPPAVWHIPQSAIDAYLRVDDANDAGLHDLREWLTLEEGIKSNSPDVRKLAELELVK